MIEIIQNEDVWEVWQGGGLQHYGTLESCGKYIMLNHEDFEDWITG